MHELKISDIEAAGFREFPVNRFSELRHVNRNWQKTYWSDEGKKQYFVTIEQWDFSEYPMCPIPYGYQASGQFTRIFDETFNIELLSPKDIPQIESFFRDIFVCMNCIGVDD